MKTRWMAISAAAALALAVNSSARNNGVTVITVELVPVQEVPALSSAAHGLIRIKIDEVTQSITYEESYDGLEGTVTQSHIHIGQAGVNGGIMLWLCGAGTTPGPTGTPTCPQSGTVTGTLLPANIVAVTTQGIAGTTEFTEVANAIKNGIAYANVHSSKFPGGEIRGQLEHGRDIRDLIERLHDH